MREELAALMHEIWGDWMKYLFSKGAIRGKDRAHIIYPLNVQRWKRQMRTPYDELSEKEKDSDRQQADKVLALLNECFAEAGRINEPVYEGTRILTSPPLEATLRCQRCGELTYQLTTQVVVDDDGNEAVLWLCNGCISSVMMDCPECGKPWPVTETIQADGSLGCSCQEG